MSIRAVSSLSPVFIAMCPFSSKSGSVSEDHSLRFPADKYTLKTITVRTSGGEIPVHYRSYLHIPYVADPLDRDYQSLNVDVPVKVDGKAIDSFESPILLNIRVAGYLSVNNRTGRVGDSAGASSAGNNNLMYLAGEAASSGSGMSSSRSRLALAAGFVVVTPGCRGRDNLALNGTYYGKAPAAIVDLKAVVRYIRHNRHIMPGNSERIISVGGSAGGALSALLGASGNSPLYDKYLEDIGAANETDHIYAGACFSPITDLEHSDMSYEWMFGDVPAQSVLVDQALSQELRGEYSRYQRSLNLRGKDNFGILSADNYDEYLMNRYLIPSANRFLKGLPEEKLQRYLETNNWIKWDGEGARFSFREYVRRMGRIKGVPAFDDFSMSSAEPVLFGSETVNARHFTEFSLSHGENDLREGIDPDLKTIVNMMNAMYFIQKNDSECAKYWWLRNGAMDNHTSQTVMTNLAAGLENRGRNVDSWIYWNKGHCGDDDPEGFISWIGDISGFYK